MNDLRPSNDITPPDFTEDSAIQPPSEPITPTPPPPVAPPADPQPETVAAPPVAETAPDSAFELADEPSPDVAEPPVEMPAAGFAATTAQGSTSLGSRVPRKALVLGGGALAVVLIGGGVAYSMFQNSSAAVLSKMFDATSTAKSVGYDVELRGEAQESAQLTAADKKDSDESFTGSLRMKGNIDAFDPKKPKAQLAIDMDVQAGKEKIKGKMELRGLDDKGYLRVSGLPKTSFVDLRFLNDRWLYFEEASSDSKDGGGTKSADTELTEAERKEIKKILAKEQPLKVVDRLKDETIGGEKSVRLVMEINKEGLKRALPQIAKAVGSKEDSAQANEEFNKSLDELTLKRIDLWIGKKDNLLRKMQFADNVKSGGMEVNYTVAATFDSYNQQNSVQKPEKAKSGEAFMAALTPTEGKDTDRDGLSDKAEVWFGTDPKKADTDGDKVKDGAEVKAGTNPAGKGPLPKELKLPTQNEIMGSLDQPAKSPVKATPKPASAPRADPNSESSTATGADFGAGGEPSDTFES